MPSEPGTPSGDSTSAVAPSELLQELESKILTHYKPELWAALKAGLAVICSQSLKDRAHPLALIFEGASGRGKSFVINMCEPDRAETQKYIYRLDTFTPRAFVTHAANVIQSELAEIDLLPKIKDKTLLTKELAPLFRGREDDLRTNFATLTSVLDGRGHMSASGSQGTRGYHGRYIFNWLGATTPIPEKTDGIMAQLGNRLLRYEIVGQPQSEDALIEFARSYSAATTEDSCRLAVNNFLFSHFTQSPPNSVEPTSIVLSEDSLRELVRLAKLISHGRVEVQRVEIGNQEPELIPGTPEGPERVILLLRTLAQGLALVGSRTEVSSEDIEVLRHACFSSLPSRRRQILRAMLTNGGALTSAEAASTLQISRPTARGMMRELQATGIVRLTAGSGTEPDKVELASDWTWLLPSDPAESEMQVCAGTTAET
jgi:hypothetical protein